MNCNDFILNGFQMWTSVRGGNRSALRQWRAPIPSGRSPAPVSCRKRSAVRQDSVSAQNWRRVSVRNAFHCQGHRWWILFKKLTQTSTSARRTPTSARRAVRSASTSKDRSVASRTATIMRSWGRPSPARPVTNSTPKFKPAKVKTRAHNIIEHFIS